MVETRFTVEEHGTEKFFRYGSLLTNEIWAEWFDTSDELGHPAEVLYEVRRNDNVIYKGRVFYLGGHNDNMLFDGIVRGSNYAVKLFPEEYQVGDVIVFNDPRKELLAEEELQDCYAFHITLDDAFKAHDESLSAEQIAEAAILAHRNSKEPENVLRFRR